MSNQHPGSGAPRRSFAVPTVSHPSSSALIISHLITTFFFLGRTADIQKRSFSRSRNPRKARCSVYHAPICLPGLSSLINAFSSQVTIFHRLCFASDEAARCRYICCLGTSPETQSTVPLCPWFIWTSVIYLRIYDILQGYV
jgi:hypothetical protein